MIGVEHIFISAKEVIALNFSVSLKLNFTRNTIELTRLIDIPVASHYCLSTTNW